MKVLEIGVVGVLSLPVGAICAMCMVESQKFAAGRLARSKRAGSRRRRSRCTT